MSRVDSYPKELLALLPLQLRQRLLRILPAFDLCHLEHTSVAAGVDTTEIWKSRPKPVPLLSDEAVDFFQLKIKRFGSTTYRGFKVLEMLREAFKDIHDGKSLSSSTKETIFFSAASDILADFNDGIELAPKIATGKLFSIEGNLLFSNLLCGSMHRPCKTGLCGQRVWKLQATSLTMQPAPVRLPYLPGGEKIHLISRDRRIEMDSRLKLFSSLANECGLQPSSALIDIDLMYDLLLPERLVLENSSSKLPPVNWTSAMNLVLSKAAILQMSCESYSHINIMTGLLEAAMDNAQLQYLFCFMPNLYMDAIQQLQMLFSLQNFRQLFLEVSRLCVFTLCKLLYEFMRTDCSHEQKLLIDVRRCNFQLPTSLRLNLAALYAGNPSLTINPEYKVFRLSAPEDNKFSSALYLLLQLPAIRLKEIKCKEYLHQCALHPDLQTSKLMIELDQNSLASSTIRADLISLVGKQSLKGFVVHGSWGSFDEVKLGLVQGLHSRIRAFPLKEIALELTNGLHDGAGPSATNFVLTYTLEDLQMLFEAVFSLPELANLQLVLGKGFADVIQQPRYEEAVHKCWVHMSGGVRLKSICFQTRETEFEFMSLVAQDLSCQEVFVMNDFSDDDEESCGWSGDSNYT